MKNKMLYDCMLYKYGKDAVMFAAIEELSELLSEITKKINCKESNIIEESVDCIIMCEQLLNIFSCGDEYISIKNQKINKISKKYLT